MKNGSKREFLIDTALRLFYEHGFHAVGIDAIVAASGIAKTTLYRYFPTKDDLILAALRRRDEWWRRLFVQGINKRAKDPRSKLLAGFEVLEEWFNDSPFRGCFFINASAEFPNEADAAHRAAAEHKRMFTQIIRGLCAEAGARNPEAMAEQLVLLMEGAIVTAQVSRRPEAARTARRTAELVLKSELDNATA
jgi:AcrR family transcriptional regulator